MYLEETSKRINVKKAVEIAFEYVLNLFGKDSITDLKLEEVALTNEGWEVTVSFTSRYINAAQVLTGSRAREYKKAIINPETGELRAVQIRKID